ncbi:MAG: hypothetical protein KF813_12735 [Trueperaceae bacterium]|nr:hypothetical protein [Trueperaceae bacterium]
MKSLRGTSLVALALLLLVAACAPAAGRQGLYYQADTREIIALIARFGPQIEPPSGYNYFSVESISETTIQLRADPLIGFSVVGFVTGIATDPARISVTSFQQADHALVAIGVSPGTLPDVYDALVAILDSRFRRY